MNYLKAYTHIFDSSGNILTSEYLKLDVWRDSVDSALKIDDVKILLNVGFDRLSDESVTEALQSKNYGVHFTESAAVVCPKEWVESIQNSKISTILEPECALVLDGDTYEDIGIIGDFPIKSKRGRPHKNPDMCSSPPTIPVSDSTEWNTFNSFSERMNYHLDRMSSDERYVLTHRWGYGCEEETLESIGIHFDVTREGVRQIEKKQVKKLQSISDIKTMLNRLKAIEADSILPIPLSALHNVDEWFDLGDFSASSFMNIIKDLSNNEIDFIEGSDEQYMVPFSKKTWHSTLNLIRANLRKLADTQVKVSIAKDCLIECLKSASIDSKYTILAWDSEAEGKAQLAFDDNGDEYLVGFGVGAAQMVIAVLFEAEVPLHRDEVIRRVKSRYAVDVTDMSITNELVKVGLIFSKSHYGLRRHIPFNDEEIAQIIGFAEDVVTNNAEKQWNTTKICEAIKEDHFFDSDFLTPHILGACLRCGKTNLVDLKKGSWKAPNLAGAIKRIHIHDSIVLMLENSGHPLTTVEIKNELSKSRDLGNNFQIQPRDPLFRIGTSTWGLIDRDLPLSKQDIEIYLDSLDKRLSETDSGIHVSEVLEVLNNSGLDISWIQDPELILSLCRRSGRLKVTQTRYLIQNHWKSEQRITPAAAVIDVVKINPALTAAEMTVLVSKSVGREIDVRLVRNILSENGFMFNTEDKKWQNSNTTDSE